MIIHELIYNVGDGLGLASLIIVLIKYIFSYIMRNKPLETYKEFDAKGTLRKEKNRFRK